MSGALRELFAKFTTEFDTKPLEKGSGAVDDLWGRVKKLGAALVESAPALALTALAESTVAWGKELVVTSEQVGVSTDALYAWRTAAQFTGLSADDMTTSFRFLQRNAYEASQGSAEAAKAFAAVGVKITDSNGKLKDGDQLLRDLADGLEKVQDPAKKVALATQILGRSGARLLPVLKGGSKAIDQLKAELEDLGVELDTSWTQKADEADNEADKFTAVIESLRLKLGRELIPAFKAFYHWATQIVGGFNKMVKGTNALKATLVVLGGIAAALAAKVLVAFAPLVVSTLAWAAAVGAAVLAIDELITLFEGGDTIIGRWIDDNFGAGKSQEWVQQAKVWWEQLSAAVKDGWGWFQTILPSIETVADALKALGKDIVFVIDQFRHLDQFGEGLKKLGHDVGVHLGLADETADEQKFKHGAEGIGSVVTSQDMRQAPDAEGRGGFFGGFSRLTGDVPAIPAPQAFIGPPAPPSTTVKNNVTVNVEANARPDPTLRSFVTGAVQDALDKQTRDISSGVGGN